MISPIALDFLDKAAKAEGAERIKYIHEAIHAEYESAVRTYGRYASPHEAEAVIRREQRELSDELLINRNPVAAVMEAVQVAATAYKLIEQIISWPRGEHINDSFPRASFMEIL